MAKHLTTNRDRRSTKYLRINALLAAENKIPEPPEQDKQERKRAASVLFRQQAI